MSRLSPHNLFDDRGPVRLTFRMVPMIDVVFLLLIFFVLTASFRASEGFLPADLPRQESQAAPLAELEPLSVWLRPGPDDSCVVTVGGGGQLKIDRDDDQNWLALCRQVQQVLRRQGRRLDDPVRLAPDPRTRWDHVVRAYDALWRMNLTNIVFAVARP